MKTRISGGGVVRAERIRLLNDAPVRPHATYVLYWALIHRRLDWNHGLNFAIETANRLGLPVLVYEALTCDHPFANQRFHQFILEGVDDNRARAKELGLGYVFYYRAAHRDPNDVLYGLATNAAALVTDDYPGYMARAYNASIPPKVGVPYYVADSNGVVPLSVIGKQEYAAYTIRPKIHRALDEYLQPLESIRVRRKWSGPLPQLLDASHEAEIDTTVAPSQKLRGGRKAALQQLQHFLEHRLSRYAKSNREPTEHATSQLSSYLHFGHISALEIALAVRDHAEQHKLIVPEFLEQLIVRRELAFNFAHYGPDPRTLAALPEWAQQTLAKHDRDKREWIYSREQFEQCRTHDALWNATQAELLRDGVIHGYHRMYWGKKIIEWSATHQDALDTMIYLHDRHALDGRDPNTYTNILWCFGLHDRPWTERPIFGMIRYMNLAGMERKTRVAAYVEQQLSAHAGGQLKLV